MIRLIVFVLFCLPSIVQGQAKILGVTLDPLIDSELESLEVNDKLLIESLSDETDRQDFHKYLRSVQAPSNISSFSNMRQVIRGVQKKAFIMDADIRTPITVIGFKRLGYNSLHLIPRFKYRIFRNDDSQHFGLQDTSNAVRTPSAMPGAAYYWTFKSWWDNEPNQYFFKHKYIGLYAFHHSNGQDGPEIRDSLSLSGFNVDSVINRYNGNFGEQIVFEFIIGGRFAMVKNGRRYRQTKRAKRAVEDRTRTNEYRHIYSRINQYNWRLGFEWHPVFATNRIFDDLDIYGKNRLNLDFTYLIKQRIIPYQTDGKYWAQVGERYDSEKWRHHFRLSYIMDRNYNRGELENLKSIRIWDLSYRLNFNYSLYFVPRQSENFAFFGELGYYGSDEYNIYFNESYWNARVGIAYGNFFK